MTVSGMTETQAEYIASEIEKQHPTGVTAHAWSTLENGDFAHDYRVTVYHLDSEDGIRPEDMDGDGGWTVATLESVDAFRHQIEARGYAARLARVEALTGVRS